MNRERERTRPLICVEVVAADCNSRPQSPGELGRKMSPDAGELSEPELAHISRTFSHMIEITKGKKHTDNETEKGRGNKRGGGGEGGVGRWGGGRGEVRGAGCGTVEKGCLPSSDAFWRYAHVGTEN